MAQNNSLTNFSFDDENDDFATPGTKKSKDLEDVIKEVKGEDDDDFEDVFVSDEDDFDDDDLESRDFDDDEDFPFNDDDDDDDYFDDEF